MHFAVEAFCCTLVVHDVQLERVVAYCIQKPGACSMIVLRSCSDEGGMPFCSTGKRNMYCRPTPYSYSVCFT